MNDEKTLVDGALRGVLRFLKGAKVGESYKLGQSSVIFGREKGDIVLSDPEVSSSHCQLQWTKEGYVIFDMNSSNGTYVNGEKVIKLLLKSGDTITLGQTQFVFELVTAQNTKNATPVFQGSMESDPAQRTAFIGTVMGAPGAASRISWKISITVSYADGSVESFDIEKTPFFIGRASSFGKFDKDSKISRQHLKVKINEQGEIFVEDQGSTNGSFLNGKQIQGIQMVGKSDRVQVGSCLLSFTTTRATS